MKRPGWSLVLFTNNSLSRPRSIALSKILIIVISLALCIGLFGFLRVIYLVSNFGTAKLAVYSEKKANQTLLYKVKFLNKYIQKESSKIERLSNYEDQNRIRFGLTKISDDIRKAGVGGFTSESDIIPASVMDPIVLQIVSIRDSLASLLRRAYVQDSTFADMSNDIEKIHEKWAKRPSIWPTRGKVTSHFGTRSHPVSGEIAFHEGLDIANNIGSPIYATADGIVKEVGFRDFYGKLIVVRHQASSLETYYAHLQKANVTLGQTIKRGDLIGYTGVSGRTTGPHLHYEVRVSGSPVNPVSYILPTDSVID